MSVKHLFIINPVAGKGNALKLVDEIEHIFKDLDEEHIIEVTQRQGHATEIVKNYVSNADYRVYSVGGDGTLNEVLNGIVNSNSSLGVIPSGSGNDFIRSVYNEKDKSLLVKKLINGNEKYIDIGKVNEKYFINIASVGIDAEITYNAIKIKKVPFLSGSLAYIISIFKTLFKYNNNLLFIDIDGVTINMKTLLIAVANGKCYGGGMLVAPKANVFDGNFDVCLVREMSKLKVLRLFPELIKGIHERQKEVSFYIGKTVYISSKDEFTLNVDGEVMRVNKATFEIMPKSVRFIIPN